MSLRLTATGLTALLVLASCGGASNDARSPPPSTPSTPSAPPPPTPPSAQADTAQPGEAGQEATPLSDLITQNLKTPTPEILDRFGKTFMSAQVGVLVKGPKTAGTFVTGKGDTSLGQTRLPDGRTMILVAADPAAFARRFGRPFNAEMDGLSVMKTVVASPTCDGILVNSAASEHSLVLTRAMVRQLLESAK